MMFRLQINKFLCVVLYFFDIFISCRKCQDTLQLNTCVKYCTKDERNAMLKVLKIHCKDLNALNAMYVRDGVCGFYSTLYAERRFHVGDVKETLYTVAPHPTRREDSL